MPRLKTLLISLAYVIFEGLSKGGTTLIFLFSASYLSASEYVNLLSLYSLEGLFITLSPSYYTDVLFKIRDNFSSTEAQKNIFAVSLIIFAISLVCIFLFQSQLVDFYSSSLLVFVSIIFIVFLRLYFQNVSVNFQIDENHKTAIIYKALPFFLSFLFSLLGFIYFENYRIQGFFVGRMLGFGVSYVIYIFVSRQFVFLNSQFSFNTKFLREFLPKSLALTIQGIAVWFMGYGSLNLYRHWFSVDINQQIALILNIWSVFLLFSNGINSVFYPKFRVAFNQNFTTAKQLYNKYSVLYFILWLTFVILYFISFIFEDFVVEFRLEKYFQVMPYVLFIFFAQIFQYISVPFYYSFDKFRHLAFINIVASVAALFIMFLHYYLSSNISVYLVLSFGYFIKSFCLFIVSIYFKKSYEAAIN